MVFPPNDGSPRKTRWQHYVGHKEESSLAEQRKSLFFGIDFKTQARIEVPRRAFDRGHCHIEGRTGAGKSAGTLMSIIWQAIKGYRDELGNWSRKSPVIVFDFKGDQALFHATRVAAERGGRTFRFFSTRKSDGCHFFDPFQVVRLRGLEPVQIATTFVRALGLDYGLMYGGLYFTDNNVVLLTDAIKIVQEAGGEPTLERLTDALEILGKRKSSTDARHILLSLKKLAEYPQVNLGRHARIPADQINMFRAIEDGEVIYIFMEMDSEAPGLRQIAGFLLDALVHAAKAFRRAGKPVPFTYLIMDEFYHIAGKCFGELLAMARDWGLHFFLANQDRAQLETHDRSIPHVIRTNTSVRQAYTIDGDENQMEWKRLSGDRIDFARSRLIDVLGQISSGFAEMKDWTLSNRMIDIVTDTQLASLLYVDSGRAAAEGSRVRCVQGLYPTFAAEYELYRNTPLPQTPKFELGRPEAPVRPEAAQEGQSRSSGAKPERAKNPELQERMSRRWESLMVEEAAA